ncbi:hypothetical protein [Ralstonia insidiosa]|uniref:hypothetical protein n=1 Tax=Ralstonia insidiosa TaxID=190721 RepID=UPI0020166566|nr:hypothetical protein [Ralstonia insidiosa]
MLRWCADKQKAAITQGIAAFLTSSSESGMFPNLTEPQFFINNSVRKMSVDLEKEAKVASRIRQKLTVHLQKLEAEDYGDAAAILITRSADLDGSHWEDGTYESQRKFHHRVDAATSSAIDVLCGCCQWGADLLEAMRDVPRSRYQRHWASGQ